MRYALIAAVAALTAAAPALATGGFECRATDGSGLRISGVVGHGIASPLGAVQLIEGRRMLSTADARPAIAIGQSWIDSREIRLDLVDPQGLRYEAQLRTSRMLRNQGTGTLIRNGRRHPVRCTTE